MMSFNWWIEYFEIEAGTNDHWFEFVKIPWQHVTTVKRGGGGGEEGDLFL